MANENIKFKTGALSNLPSTYTAGQVLFAIDENNIGYIYFDKNNSTRILMSSNAQYAEKANKDASNQIITATYLKNIKGAKNSGETTYDLTGISGSGGDVTTTASVPITLVSSSNKTGTKLYLLGATSQTTKGVAGYSNSAVFINTSNQLEATSGFKGNLTGTASSASSVAWSGITGVPANVTNIANWKGSVFSVIGTQTSTTGAWTGRLDAIQDVSGLYDGLTIMYYLPRNGSGNATLNLTFANGSNTGAVPVYWTGTSRATTHYSAGSTIRLTYWSAGSISVNGTATTEARWTAADYDSNSNTIPSAYCETAAGTAAKGASCTNYSLTDNTYIHVLMRYANTFASAITLNINSKGAKPIYINGEASSTTNYALPAGTYIAYYDGTAYQFRTDGVLPGSILYANSAGSATYDSNNQEIYKTYIKSLSVSGRTITYTKGDGSTGTITTQDNNTDTKVNVTLATTTKAYLLGTSTPPTATAQGVTAIADTGVYLDTTAGVLTAATFKGNLAWSYLTSVPQIVEGALATNTAASGIVIQLYNLAGNTIAETNTATNGKITIPAANGSGTNNVAGLVTTAAQTWAGEKTFKGNIVMDAEQRIQSRIKRKKAGGGGWEYKGFQFIGNDNVDFAHIGVFGDEDTLTFMYIGSAEYTADTNLRIYPNGDVTAKTFKGNLAWSYLTSVPQIVEGALGSVLSSDKTKYRIQLKNLSGSDIASSSAATNGVIDVPIDQVGSSNKTSTKLYIIGTTAQSADAATGYSNSNIYITTGNKIHGNLEGKADTAGAADTATKATQDASGNVITSNYAASLTGTANSDKYTLVLKAKNNGDLSTVNIPAATTSTIGLVTTAAQTFAGAKTFTGTIQRYYGSASTEPMISLVSNNLDAIALQMGHGTAAGVATQNYYKIVYNGAGSQPNNLFKLIAAKTTDTEVVAMSVNEEGNVTFTNTVAASISGTAARATADANGDNIRSTYLKNLKGTTSTTTYTIVGVRGGGGEFNTNAVVPAATTSVAGLITTGTQTMAGAKTFSTSISTPQLTVTGASKFEYSGIQAGSDNADRVVWFAYNGKNGIPVYDNDFKYNPSTNKLTVSNIAGSTITLSSGNDSTHSTEDATLKVTGGVSVSLRLSAKMIRVDNGETATTKGFNLVYDTTQECLKFQFGN